MAALLDAVYVYVNWAEVYPTRQTMRVCTYSAGGSLGSAPSDVVCHWVMSQQEQSKRK
jgi:hypothetical protein